MNVHVGDVAAGLAGDVEFDGARRQDGGGDDDTRKADELGDGGRLFASD